MKLLQSIIKYNTRKTAVHFNVNLSVVGSTLWWMGKCYLIFLLINIQQYLSEILAFLINQLLSFNT